MPLTFRSLYDVEPWPQRRYGYLHTTRPLAAVTVFRQASNHCSCTRKNPETALVGV